MLFLKFRDELRSFLEQMFIMGRIGIFGDPQHWVANNKMEEGAAACGMLSCKRGKQSAGVP
jgi:hypothetical protein